MLSDNEQYRMQMAGISTAALGYWREGDTIHPDYDTVALHDVADLYRKYADLRKAKLEAQVALYGCREVLGDVANIQHAIDLLENAR